MPQCDAVPPGPLGSSGGGTLFTALVPPDEALDHLAAAVEPVRAAWPELRWVRPERWHTTVTFLGAVPDDVVPGLVAALAGALAEVRAPTLQLAGAGRFPGGRGPLRALWVGVRGATAPVVAASAAAARAGGVVLDDREHVPHLTLARAEGRGRRDPTGGERAHGPVAPLAAYAGPAWPAASVHLLRSRPGRPGPYEEVARFPLGGMEDAARGTMSR